MKSYEIKQAANGFIVGKSIDRDMGCCGASPHVFETFDAMSDWLKKQFDSAEMAPAQPDRFASVQVGSVQVGGGVILTKQ